MTYKHPPPSVSFGGFATHWQYNDATTAGLYVHRYASEGSTDTQNMWMTEYAATTTSIAAGSTLSVSAQFSVVYFPILAMPFKGTIDSVSGWVEGNSSPGANVGTPYFTVWKASPADRTTANVTWTAVNAGATTSSPMVQIGLQSFAQDASTTYNSLDQGDLIALTIDWRDGRGTSTNNPYWYFAYGLELSPT
jgi:hypothetical protein